MPLNALVTKTLQEHPAGLLWMGFGFLLAQGIRLLAYMIRKDRDSVGAKVKKLFEWIENAERDFRNFKTHAAETYATKQELLILRDDNRKDHDEIKMLLAELRGIIISKRLAE